MRKLLLEALAQLLDDIVRWLAPLLPGLRGGGVACWDAQPITQFESLTLPRAFVLRGFGLEVVLDRELQH